MPKSQQEKGMMDPESLHVNEVVEQEKHINEPTLRTEVDRLANNTSGGESIKSEESDIQPEEAPQSPPQCKGADVVKAGDEEASESEQARIERMGRERPEKFKSFAAELAFCYSVIASQFMSVRSPAAITLQGTNTR